MAFNADERAALDSCREVATVSVTLPDRFEDVMTDVYANLANIRLVASYMMGDPQMTATEEDRVFLRKSILQSCDQVDETLSRAGRLITGTVLGEEFAEAAYGQLPGLFPGGRTRRAALRPDRSAVAVLANNHREALARSGIDARAGRRPH